MSAWTAVLRVGLALVFDGEQFTVAEIEGRRILLRQVAGGTAPGLRQVDVNMLLSHPTTRILTPSPIPEPGIAAILDNLSDDADEELTTRFRHVQEVVTGFRLGDASLALPGEPRGEYAPEVPMMARYAAKAAELGVSQSTVRNWVRHVRNAGPAGLVSVRRSGNVLDRADPRWVEQARAVLAGYVQASRPVRNLVLIEIEERLAEAHGRGTVRLPGRTTGYALLDALSKGTNAFEGSTKGKRSIANRPVGVYGRLRATRPGEYVVLDTNRLDVYAMEPVTCRWVQCELSVAMDLYSRVITGLRLAPVSTKSVDVAGVLFETVLPRPAPASGDGLPFCGVPSTVVMDAGRLVDANGQVLLPSVAAETIVFDHGSVYLSNHLRSVCSKLDISLQPARPYTPTDKPVVERWFRTLNLGLLAALPGYKGSDVHSRGAAVEDEAYFFLDELEAVIREWIAQVYHRRHHTGLAIPEVPGLELSPLEMFEHGITRAGTLRIPARPELALEFLEVVGTSIQHYGVELEGLRYNGDGLDDYRNVTSSFGGLHAGKWPISVDPGDMRRVWFQDPKDHAWHGLDWEHAAALDGPFSREAVIYARRLAKRTQRFPDTKRALVELLKRWGTGLTADRAERRMAVRLSADRLRLVHDAETEQLPTVRRLAALAHHADDDGLASADGPAEGLNAGGDDDDENECDSDLADMDVLSDRLDEDDFYADALDSR